MVKDSLSFGPLEVSVSIQKNYFPYSRLAKSSPKVRFCLAHGGGAFPFTIGRFHHGHFCRPDLCAHACSTDPREFLGKIWTDSLVHDNNALEYLVKTIGKDRVLLGSDYPFPLGEIDRKGLLDQKTDLGLDLWNPMEREGKVVENADFLTDEEKEDILADNVFRFVGRSREDYL